MMSTLPCSKIVFKEINNFIQQGCTELIKSDSKDFYIKKDFYFQQHSSFQHLW